jgi:hypothetical protein
MKDSFKAFLESIKTEMGDPMYSALVEAYDTYNDYEAVVTNQPDATTIECIILLNKCLKYLEFKGNEYLPNRLTEYLNKLNRLYGKFENEAHRAFDELYVNYKNMTLEQITDALVKIRGLLGSYLPENMRHLPDYL